MSWRRNHHAPVLQDSSRRAFSEILGKAMVSGSCEVDATLRVIGEEDEEKV